MTKWIRLFRKDPPPKNHKRWDHYSKLGEYVISQRDKTTHCKWPNGQGVWSSHQRASHGCPTQLLLSKAIDRFQKFSHLWLLDLLVTLVKQAHEALSLVFCSLSDIRKTQVKNPLNSLFKHPNFDKVPWILSTHPVFHADCNFF